MTDSTVTPSRFASAAPTFAVADVGATAGWYRDALGFTVHPFPPDEPYAFADLARDAIELMLLRVEGFRKPEVDRPEGIWDAYLRVEGVDELYAELRDRVEIVMTLRQQQYGDWEFAVRDPNGYRLVFSELKPLA